MPPLCRRATTGAPTNAATSSPRLRTARRGPCKPGCVPAKARVPSKLHLGASRVGRWLPESSLAPWLLSSRPRLSSRQFLQRCPSLSSQAFPLYPPFRPRLPLLRPCLRRLSCHLHQAPGAARPPIYTRKGRPRLHPLTPAPKVPTKLPCSGCLCPSFGEACCLRALSSGAPKHCFVSWADRRAVVPALKSRVCIRRTANRAPHERALYPPNQARPDSAGLLRQSQRLQWCEEEDSNLHGSYPTSTSSWRVCHSATFARCSR